MKTSQDSSYPGLPPLLGDTTICRKDCSVTRSAFEIKGHAIPQAPAWQCTSTLKDIHTERWCCPSPATFNSQHRQLRLRVKHAFTWMNHPPMLWAVYLRWRWQQTVPGLDVKAEYAADISTDDFLYLRPFYHSHLTPPSTSLSTWLLYTVAWGMPGTPYCAKGHQSL